jgi:hypothetical protein
MKRFLICCLVIIPNLIFSQNFYISVPGGGNWNSDATWDLDGDGLDIGTDGIPGANDIAVIIGDNAGGGNVNITGNVFVGDIYIQFDNPNVLSKTSAAFVTNTLTIHGQLVGFDFHNTFDIANPTTTVIENDNRLNIVFTGDNIVSGISSNPAIFSWSHSSPLRNLSFNPSSSSTNIQVEDLAIFGTSNCNISNGIVTINSGFSIAQSSAATLTVSNGTTLVVNGGINGDGTSSSLFGTIINNGTITTGTAGYMNAELWTLGANSNTSINFNGANQTEGWWFQSNSPTTVTEDVTSTVTFGANAAQNIPAVNYGNLVISGNGTKTLSSTGTLNVTGDLTISSASTIFNSSSNPNFIDIFGDLDNNGTWTPTQLVIFSSPFGAQTIGGNNVTTFGGGLRIENTVGTVSLNNVNADINGELDVDPGATFSPSDQVVTMSGNMRIDGTLSAGTDPSGFVFDGTTSFLGTGTRNFNDVTITGTVNAPSATLNVAGDFTDNGIFNANSGTINFNGAQAQVLNGSVATNFNNVNITKSSTTNSVTVSTAKNLVGIITLSANSAFNSNGNLTLVSDASGDATVAAIPASAIFSGDVIYQRYLDVGNTRWANVGMPIPTPVSNLITAGLTTGGSLYTYDETVTGDVDQGWVEETGTLADNNGYTLYMYNGEVPATINVIGALNTTAMSIPVTFTNTGDAAADGWNLVNNPYASSIDWGSGSWTKTNLVANCAVWNGSTYSYFSSGLISSGQAFWVQANGASPVLTATQSVKSNSAQALQRVSPDNELKVVVSNDDETDFAKIMFREDATEEFDAQYDARKLNNAIHNVSTLSLAGENLAINSIPEASCDRIIDLKINQADGDYDLYLEGLSSLTAGYNVSLVDHLTGQTIAFNSSTIYSFNIDKSNAATYGAERFDLVLTSITLDDSVEPTYAVSDDCYNTEASITLTDVQDGIAYHIEDGSGLILSNKVVASNGVASVSLSKSALISNTPYQLTVIGNADNECSGTLTYAKLVDYEFASIPEITNTTDAEVCVGYEGGITLEAEGAPKFGSYRWYLDATTPEPIAGANLSYLEIASLAEAKQSYFVSALNEAGCEGSRVEIKVNTFSLEKPTVEDAVGCLGGNVTLGASGAPEDGYYRWYTSMDSGTPIADENSNSLLVESLATNRSYYVSIVNANGCESERVKFNIDLYTLTAPIVAGASTCIGGNVSLGATGAPENGYYRWYTSIDSGTPIADENSNSLLVESLATNRSYYVSIVNANGCESDRVSVVAQVEVLESPDLIVSGDKLLVNVGSAYQWYLNDNPIDGATENTITVTSSGTYKVEIFEGECSAFSNSRQLVVTGIDDVLFKLGLNIYPNPVADLLYLQYKGDDYKFELFDLKGNAILRHEDLVNNREISYFNLSGLISGVYILNIEADNGTVIPLRILKK